MVVIFPNIEVQDLASYTSDDKKCMKLMKLVKFC